MGLCGNGAMFQLLQEAASISSLKPALEAKGIPLYGILHEEGGAESFKKYLKGPLFLDREVWSKWSHPQVRVMCYLLGQI